MARDAEIKLIVDTKTATKQLEEFNKVAEKALNVKAKSPYWGTKQKEIEQYQGQLEKLEKTQEKIDANESKLVANRAEQAKLEGPKGLKGSIANLKSAIGGSADKDAAREKVTKAEEELQKLKTEENKLVATGDKLNKKWNDQYNEISKTKQVTEAYLKAHQDVETTTKKSTDNAKKTADAENEIAKATREVSGETQQNVAAEEQAKKAVEEHNEALQRQKKIQSQPIPKQQEPVTSGKKISPDVEKANKSIADMVQTIYNLRLQEEDATVETAKLEARLQAFDTSRADIADVKQEINQLNEALKLIDSGVEHPEKLKDVFKDLHEALGPAKQTFSEFQAGTKSTISEYEKQMNAMRAFVAAAGQIFTEEQNAESQQKALWATSLVAAYKQARAEEQAKLQQTIEEQQQKELQHTLTGITALATVYRQAKEEENEKLKQTLDDQQRKDIQERTTWITSLATVYTQASQEERALIQQELERARTGREQIDPAVKAQQTKQTQDNVNQFVSQLAVLNQATQQYQDDMKMVAETIAAIPAMAFGTFDEAKTNLDQLNAAIKAIEDYDKIDEMAHEYNLLKTAQVQATQAQRELNREVANQSNAIAEEQKLQDKIQNIANVVERADTAFSMPNSKLSIQELIRLQEQLAQAHSALKNGLLDNDPALQQYYDKIIDYELKVKELISERKAEMNQTFFSSEDGQIVQATASGLDSLGSAFSNASSYAINFSDILNIVRLCMGDVSAAVPLITSLFSKLTNAINATIETIKNLISNMIKFTTSVANKFFSVMKNGLAGLSKAGNSIGGSDNPFNPQNIKRALQLLTKYVFGFRSFFFLYRRLRKLIGEGIENLVQFESETNETNKAITELKTSLLYIKNAWAAAFAPIINVVTPLLVTLMNAIADVGNAIARFVGALTGQEVVLNAVRVDAGDYAKSLDNAGGSASKAADKTKKLTDRLAAFDDLNVLGRDKDPDATGSGGGGGGADSLEPDPNSMFQYVDAVSKFADMVKEAWRKVDFTEIGELVRDKIIEALKKPFGKSWDELKDLAYNIGKGLMTFLNGVFADPQMWRLIGATIGEGLNTIGSFVQGLLENNKINFGFNFAELLITAFKKFDVHLFLSNLESVVNLLVANINAFFNRMFVATQDKGIFSDISKMAEGLTRALINLILGIDWETIAKTALFIGNAILDGIIRALESDDNTILHSLGGILRSVVDGVNELLPALKPLIDTLKPIVEDVLDEAAYLLPIVIKILTVFVSKWLPQIVKALDKIRPVLSWIVEVGLSLLLAALEGLDFDTLVNDILNVLQVVMAVVSWFSLAMNPLLAFGLILTNIGITIARVIDSLMSNDKFIQLGQNLILGLYEGISDMLDDTESWFRTYVFEPIAEAFMRLFGIHSPSTVFAEYGDDIIQGLLDGINARIEEVIQVFTDLKESISEKWDDIKSATAQKWTEIGEAIKSKVFDIKNNIVGEFSDVKDKIVQKFTEIVGGISEAFASLKEAVKAPLNAAIDVIESFVNKVIKGINDLVKNFDGISEIASEVGLTVPELKIPTISIPRLAQGAVIPPNKEFMAVLGDQSHGTNIEAPLDTIKQAMAEVLNSTNGNAEVIQLLQQLIAVVESKELNIGDKQIGQANARYTARQNLIRGTSF